jgi:cyclopropane-fatty-acyl-phospholipid synthase
MQTDSVVYCNRRTSSYRARRFRCRKRALKARRSRKGDSPPSARAAPRNLISRLFTGRKYLSELFAKAGITVDGPNPWDPQIRDERFFTRTIGKGTLGMGESYMDGDWDCAALDQFFDRAISARLGEGLSLTVPRLVLIATARIRNRQNIRRATQVARTHYDLPTDIFEATFDGRLTASCGYRKDAATLDDAQEAKLDLICRKIGLKEGDTLLDIGCGWGSYIGFAAERYGAHCVGITVSSPQVEYIKARYAKLPVEALVQDYRNYHGPKVDYIVSVGMFEHVGAKNHRAYFECARQHIKDNGLFLLLRSGKTNATLPSTPGRTNIFSLTRICRPWEKSPVR